MSVSATNTSAKETREASTQTENSVADVGEFRRRPFYPRALKLEIVNAVQNGEHCRDVARRFRLHNTQVVYKILNWNRNKGDHELTGHRLGTYLKQCETETIDPELDPNDLSALPTSVACDNLKRLDEFKCKESETVVRLSHGQAALLKELLKTIQENSRKASSRNKKTKKRMINVTLNLSPRP